MDNDVTVQGGGCLGFLAVGTFLVFLYLKLAGIGAVATWSWWWVTAPLWGYVLLGLVFLAVVVLVVLIGALIVFLADR